MQEVTHIHTYPASPSLEILTPRTLQSYLSQIPTNPSLKELVRRTEIERELAFHPQVSPEEREAFRIRRVASDEQLMAHGIRLQDIHTTVGEVFAPIIFGIGADMQHSTKLMYTRARRVLDKCEDKFHTDKQFVLGLCSEIFFGLAMNSSDTAVYTSLGREDAGFRYAERRLCWDALVCSTGRSTVPEGLYRVQIKHAGDHKDYHPDIVVVHVNPHGIGHIPEEHFIDFTRRLLPGTRVSHAERDALEGKIHSLRHKLQAHGPSTLRKVADACLMAA